MKSAPVPLLSCLLLALCVLCGWQWQRENSLRHISQHAQQELQQLRAEQAEREARVEAANAEILRLTGTLTELRAASVSRSELETAHNEQTRLQLELDQKSKVLAEQNAIVHQANRTIESANESIRRLTQERDATVQKLNALQAKYNQLAQP